MTLFATILHPWTRFLFDSLKHPSLVQTIACRLANRCQAIICSNAGMLLIEPFATIFSEILTGPYRCAAQGPNLPVCSVPQQLGSKQGFSPQDILVAAETAALSGADSNCWRGSGLVQYRISVRNSS